MQWYNLWYLKAVTLAIALNPQVRCAIFALLVVSSLNLNALNFLDMWQWHLSLDREVPLLSAAIKSIFRPQSDDALWHFFQRWKKTIQLILRTLLRLSSIFSGEHDDSASFSWRWVDGKGRRAAGLHFWGQQKSKFKWMKSCSNYLESLPFE